MEPIQSNYTLERVQIDLADESYTTPHNGNHWILHIKDHLSKYSFLYALPDKISAGVARCIAQRLGVVGIPQILQCGNGTEVKGIRLPTFIQLQQSCIETPHTETVE